MKVRKVLLTVTTVMLLTTGSAWAHNEGEWGAHTNRHGYEHGHRHWFGHWIRQWLEHRHGHGHGHSSGNGYGLMKVPEIDAASGTSATVLLTGVLLLAGERLRSRRS